MREIDVYYIKLFLRTDFEKIISSILGEQKL